MTLFVLSDGAALVTHGTPVKVTICDTSPLIHLMGIGLLNLLPLRYERIVVPEMVVKEFEDGAVLNDPDLRHVSWITIEPDPQLPSWLQLKLLGPGESMVIALALDFGRAHSTLILDEKYGRGIAKRAGFNVEGTIKIIEWAKHDGHISQVAPILDAMIAQGRRISKKLRDEVVLRAGEPV